MRAQEFVKSHRRVGDATQWDWRPKLEQPPRDDAQYGYGRRGSEADQRRNQHALHDTRPTQNDRSGRKQVCLVPGLVEGVISRGAGRFGETAVAVVALVLNRWDQAELAV